VIKTNNGGGWHMAATPEKRVKDKCVELIKNFNAYHFFPPANGMGRAGIPDIVVCFKGKFLGIECKAGANKTTALQERELAAIQRAGGSAMVIREDTLEFLRDWFIRES
jgi:hypothetical protein